MTFCLTIVRGWWLIVYLSVILNPVHVDSFLSGCRYGGLLFRICCSKRCLQFGCRPILLFKEGLGLVLCCPLVVIHQTRASSPGLFVLRQFLGYHMGWLVALLLCVVIRLHFFAGFSAFTASKCLRQLPGMGWSRVVGYRFTVESGEGILLYWRLVCCRVSPFTSSPFVLKCIDYVIIWYSPVGGVILSVAVYRVYASRIHSSRSLSSVMLFMTR